MSCARHRGALLNIIGFPNDTEDTVLEHLRILREFQPDVASFYILTPSGDQYVEFLEAGLICEPNLDRFDGSCPTWRHPHLSHDRWRELLFHCYTEFYANVDVPADSWATIARWRDWGSPDIVKVITQVFALLARAAVAAHQHPMAGGLVRFTRDRVDDYSELRRRFYGFDLLPLPGALTVTREVTRDGTSDE